MSAIGGQRTAGTQDGDFKTQMTGIITFNKKPKHWALVLKYVRFPLVSFRVLQIFFNFVHKDRVDSFLHFWNDIQDAVKL